MNLAGIVLQEYPTLPSDTGAWLVILTIVVSTIGYIAKRWVDIQVEKSRAKIATAENKVVTLKQQLEHARITSLPPILYVDDRSEDYDLVKRMLKRCGCEHEVTWCSSPADGLWYLKENSVLFVLVDLNMVSNGHRFLEDVKSDPTISDVPIVVVSGVLPEDIKIYQRGAIGYLPKPIQLSSLLEVMARHGCVWQLCIN